MENLSEPFWNAGKVRETCDWLLNGENADCTRKLCYCEGESATLRGFGEKNCDYNEVLIFLRKKKLGRSDRGNAEQLWHLDNFTGPANINGSDGKEFSLLWRCLTYASLIGVNCERLGHDECFLTRRKGDMKAQRRLQSSRLLFYWIREARCFKLFILTFPEAFNGCWFEFLT